MRMRLLICLFVAATLVACGGIPKRINPDYQLKVSDADYKSRLEDWFNCDECVNGQLRRVQELGNKAVPDLIDARSGAMIEVGGAELDLADSDAVLLARCTRLVNRVAGDGLVPAQTINECVDRFKENRERRYKGRASIALLVIRTKSACDELGLDANNKPVCEVLKPFYPNKPTLPSGRSTRAIVDP